MKQLAMKGMIFQQLQFRPLYAWSEYVTRVRETEM
jgi:hypothetical protein